MAIRIIRTTSNDNYFKELITGLDGELNIKYGELQKQYDNHNIIEQNNTVVIAKDEDTPVGCGCFKPFDENTVEIKRMFVSKENRGKGISKLILGELEKWALEKGFKNAVLETGIKQYEAIALYEKAGYQRIENYGQYIGNLNSICMKKKLH